MSRVARGAAAVAMTAIALATLGAGTAPVAAAAQAEARWAPAATATIRPGVTTATVGGGICTSNFVFASGGHTFLGQAAHCAGTGASTETDGCTSATLPLGTPVTVEAADRTERHATLVYSSWVTMQADGETDPDVCAYNDFALVEIDPADVADLNPSVPFFGGPTGLRTDGLRPGDLVHTYGNSPVRLDTATLSPKVGVAAADEGGGRGHTVYTLSPGVPGDSGSAFLDADGRALGLLATLTLAPLPVSNGVADLSNALAYADAHSGLGDIALVTGTEPFTPTPPGVPPMQLSAPAGPPISAS